MQRIDQNQLTIEHNNVIIFAKIHNESLRLPFFINYHRRLGVSKFVILDNNSTDDSRQYLLSQPDIITYFSDMPFAESQGGTKWLNPLLDRYGNGKWTLTLDADELLIYPYCEYLGIVDFCTYLESRQRNALKTMMVDMYADKPIRDTHYHVGESFIDTCPYFDPEPATSDGRGGPRKRLFWDHQDPPPEIKPPMIRKTPLVKWQQGQHVRENPHLLRNIKPAEETGALLHFKFFSEFIPEVDKAVEAQNYWDQSSQYRVYQQGLQAKPDLSFYYDRSARYQDSHQLSSLGLITSSTQLDQFSKMIETREKQTIKEQHSRQRKIRRKSWFNYLKSTRRFSHYWLWLKVSLLKLPITNLHLPWFTLPVIDWLNSRLTKEMHIFEWGSGVSTLYFADRCAQVFSIEHDKIWYAKITEQLAQIENVNASVQYIPIHPGFIVPLKPASEFVRANPKIHYRDMQDIPYVQKIQEFPDQHFDFVIVDGRLRNACAFAAMSKVKIGGCLVFDDAQRPRYTAAQNEFKQDAWEKLSFFGPSPSMLWTPFKDTCVYVRKK